MSPRVLVDLSVAPPGGAGTYAAGFARGLVEADLSEPDRVVVVVDRLWADDHRSSIDALRHAGMTVDELAFDAPGTWRARLRRGGVLRRAVERHGVDVAFFPRDVVPRLRRPYVLLANNLYAWRRFTTAAAIGGRVPAFLLRRLAHRSARGASAVLAVSQAMADAMADDVVVTAIVHHGCSMAEADRRLPDGPEVRPVVAMIGNVIANKGIEVAIEGVALARQGGEAWELRVYGNRSDPAYAEEVARGAEAALGASVLRGPAYGDDLVAAYQDAHVVVMGGTFESFCFPLVEAMRSGCVVAAPSCPLVHEICGDVAVTYAEGDATSLSAALGVAWADRHERSGRSVERARAFTWARTVEETIGHVRSAVGSR